MLPEKYCRLLMILFGLTFVVAMTSSLQAQSTAPQVTWHWHMHQPIYWNDQLRTGGVDRYEYAWESIQQKDGGAQYPENNLREIFGKDDRVAAYQYRMRDALSNIGGGHPNSGAATSYSGALMENVASLGDANQLGYNAGWAGAIDQANGWTTSQGGPRLDIVNFSYHHALMGLHNPETVYMELKLHQEKVKEIFGTDALSKGYFPSEMTFSVRQIPTLRQLGIDWAIVSGEHVARACPDFPVVYGSGGINCAPPNKADQINPNGESFIRVSIDRGCSPVHANPLSYQPAYAQYVDPETGTIDKVIVVPADMSQGWRDGYACIDASFLSTLADRNDPAQPSLVLLSHDGDNAFGGGFSYYNECVNNLANDATSRGGAVTSVQEYLDNFPPETNKVIHVEDGGWAYADSDFGSPSYINWNYPLLNAQGQHDPANGWHEKPREMALFTETLNRVLTAQQISGHSPDFSKILHPDASTHAVDRAWHYYLGSLDSGNVYFGTPLDLEIKAAIGCNEAFEHTDPIINGALSSDATPPTIWIPQRFPYNPGSSNFGVEFGYQEFVDDGDFHIWTFVADVSGPPSVTLKYRVDADGVNPLSSIQNETYAGGAEVGAWQTLAMTGRDFPANVPAGYSKPEINYTELPLHIARHYVTEVNDLRDVLIDYYVEATDTRGNTSRSPIQHVYVGDGSGSTPEPDAGVEVSPNPPVRGTDVTVTYDSNGRNLDGQNVYIHHGDNDWDRVYTTDPYPAMSDAGDGLWSYTFTVAEDANQIDMVFNNNAGTWDNNGGADWHFTTAGEPTSPTANFNATPLSGEAPLFVQFNDLSLGGPTKWSWDFDEDGSEDAASSNPSHTYTEPGSYDVSLTVSNALGSDTQLRTGYIVVTEAANDEPVIVSPDPPQAGYDLTVTYDPAGRPLSGASQVYLHYGFDGWIAETIGHLAMQATGDGRWELTLLVPEATTVFNCVFNNDADAMAGIWDNNGGLDWQFDVEDPVEPAMLVLSRTSITAQAEVGQNAPDETFTVSNGGDGELPYQITTDFGAEPGPVYLVDIADAILGNIPENATYDINNDGTIDIADTVSLVERLHWLRISPLSGTATQTPQLHTMSFASADLSPGSYQANVFVSANADNSPQTINVELNINEVSETPSLDVSTTSIEQRVSLGRLAPLSAFEISNPGEGTLDYTLTLVDTGDGTDWFTLSQMTGSVDATLNDRIEISYDSQSLTAGTYTAAVQISGNAPESPVSLPVSLDILAPPPAPSITIGAGPSLGVITEGIEYFEEFQDWSADDLRALDTTDASDLGDGLNDSRDLVAFYSRLEGDNLYLRIDLLDLALGAESGGTDLYVLIDCAPEGSIALPNGINGSTSRSWDLAVATYDAVNQAIIEDTGSTISGAHLGSYWRSDLDAVEFGVSRAALTAAGWDGSSPLHFNVFTAKDFGTEVADSFDLGSGISSEQSAGRAKFATIAHGNQSLNRGDSMRDRIYIDAASTGTGHPSGLRMTLETHGIFQIPLNIHASATLLSAIGWITDADPRRDGQSMLASIGSFVDADQSTDPGMLIGGVFAEHIMPFFHGDANRNSIEHFSDMTRELWGLGIEQMPVMHVPERVINASSSETDTFDDILASGHRATYLDEVAHLRDWFYPADAWTGIGGEYGQPRQHKVHLLDGVYTFQINDQEDQFKFEPYDGGANMNWRYNLLWKALDTDQDQLTLIFDDWEALAGYSFGSGYNNNAVQYNTNMRWVANHPWIEVVTLDTILERATNPAAEGYSANWVIDQGSIGDKPFNTYDYLHHATEDSYANWYFGSSQEQSFRDAVPVVDGYLGGGTALPSGKIFGDLDTPGSLIHDTWDALQTAPAGNLRRTAELGFQAMIYETAWHDEDNTDYTRDSNNNYHGWLYPDASYDNISGWALTLHSHLRDVGVTLAAAQWADALSDGTRPAGVTTTAIDLDQDGQNEYVLANEWLWLAFEARGGRCVQAYYYDAQLNDALSLLGSSPINNPTGQGEEEGTSTASRCSAFKEMNDDIYADVIYTVSLLSDGLQCVSPDGKITKTMTLASDGKTLSVSYQNQLDEDLYTRLGIGVNQLSLLTHGQHYTTSFDTSTYAQTNNQRGAMTLQTGAGATINALDEYTRQIIPLVEQWEVKLAPGESHFTITVP